MIKGLGLVQGAGVGTQEGAQCHPLSSGWLWTAETRKLGPPGSLEGWWPPERGLVREGGKVPPDHCQVRARSVVRLSCSQTLSGQPPGAAPARPWLPSHPWAGLAVQLPLRIGGSAVFPLLRLPSLPTLSPLSARPLAPRCFSSSLLRCWAPAPPREHSRCGPAFVWEGRSGMHSAGAGA